MTVNKQFFDDLMQDKRISLRAIARHMNVSPSQLSRTLTGHRRMQLNEAAAIASLLGASIVDVMVNAGIEGARSDQRYIPIVGHLSGDFTVTGPDPTVVEKVVLPSCLPYDTEAVQARTTNTPLAYMDGWLMYVGPPMKPTEAIGCYCLVKLTDNQIAGVLSRGYQPGTFSITSAAGVSLQNQRVTNVRKIYLTQHA